MMKILLGYLSLFLFMLTSLLQVKIGLTKLETSEKVKQITSLTAINKSQEDYQDLIQCIEEGIVVVKNDQLKITNKIFRQILKRLKLPYSKVKNYALDLKIFKLYRQSGLGSEVSCSDLNGGEKKSTVEGEIGRVFSIRQLMNKSQKYFNDKIFEMTYEADPDMS